MLPTVHPPLLAGRAPARRLRRAARPPRGPRSIAASAAAAGFTVMELLVVITLITVLAGLGISTFRIARRNFALGAAASQLRAVLRSARNTAIATGVSSRVVVDPAARVARASAFEVLGEWGLDEGGGAGKGRLGGCLAAGSSRDCGASSRWNVRRGVVLEAWVRHELEPPPRPPAALRAKRAARLSSGAGGRGRARPSREGEARAIIAKKGAYGLGMTESGALEGAVGDWRARTAPGVVAAGRWVFVRMRFEPGVLSLAVDGVDRGWRPLSPAVGRVAAPGSGGQPPREIPVNAEPLAISSSGNRFPGQIDEVRILGSIEPVSYHWSPDQRVLGWKKVIRFDRRGRLDPAWHSEGVRIVLVEDDDDGTRSPRTTLAIDDSLTFDEWVASTEADPASRRRDAPSASELERRIERRYRNARTVPIEIDLLGVVR